MKRLYYPCGILFTLILFCSSHVSADTGLPAITITDAVDGSQTYSLSIQIMLAMTALTFLPAILMMVTSFTRIIIVLAILRQALGTAQTPTNQILLGLALFMTMFIMAPVFNKVNVDALQPYQKDEITVQEAFDRTVVPFKQFMFDQTRSNELDLFTELSGGERYQTARQTPITIMIPAFITSELKTAFQIGFIIFLPFLIIDLVVASILMSMGMMMMSPMIVSLPFKLMLFVLVDGWTLIMTALAGSFYI